MSKPSKSDLKLVLCNFLINDAPLSDRPNWSPPSIGYARISTTNGYRYALLNLADNTLVEIEKDKVIEHLSLVIGANNLRLRNSINRSIIADVFDSVTSRKGLCRMIDENEIVPLRPSWDKRYCYERVDVPLYWDIEETPMFDEMLSRMTNAKAFRLFLGSLIDPTANKNQYVWLVGNGEDGKSTFTDALRAWLKTSSTTINLPDKEDSSARFFAAKTYRYRLAIVPDVKNRGFVRSTYLKSLTGERTIEFEPKGKDARPGINHVKLLFTSNVMPAIRDNKAEMRRLILCEITGIKGRIIPNAFDLFLNEMPSIMGKCYEEYENEILNKRRVVIPTEGAVPDSALTDDARLFREFKKRFEFTQSPHDSLSYDDVFGEYAEFTGGDYLFGSTLGRYEKAWLLNSLVDIGAQRKHSGNSRRLCGIRRGSSPHLGLVKIATEDKPLTLQ